jgi:DNA-binding NarL/FixJ family response regulator
VRLVQSAARGNGDLPPELLSHLLDQVNRLNNHLLEPRGLHVNGLTDRERDILRLIAEGLSTREVATRLAYSERTIKAGLQSLTSRLQMRNRTQAVAYAVRNGWI